MYDFLTRNTPIVLKCADGNDNGDVAHALGTYFRLFRSTMIECEVRDTPGINIE